MKASSPCLHLSRIVNGSDTHPTSLPLYEDFFSLTVSLYTFYCLLFKGGNAKFHKDISNYLFPSMCLLPFVSV